MKFASKGSINTECMLDIPHSTVPAESGLFYVGVDSLRQEAQMMFT